MGLFKRVFQPRKAAFDDAIRWLAMFVDDEDARGISNPLTLGSGKGGGIEGGSRTDDEHQHESDPGLFRSLHFASSVGSPPRAATSVIASLVRSKNGCARCRAGWTCRPCSVA
jgi:hypothetical protein